MGLFSFLPTEDKFYRYLEQLTDYANQSVRLLHQLLSLSPEERQTDSPNGLGLNSLCEQIAKTKAAAKKLNYVVTAEVCRTFITPFDREDIQAFATHLYHIPKLIEKIQDRVVIHGLQNLEGDFLKLLEVSVHEGQILQIMVQSLSKSRNLSLMEEKTTQLHELEEQGDKILTRLIADLFYSVQDTREVILRQHVYEMLESVTDLYRDAANVALQIVLKHS